MNPPFSPLQEWVPFRLYFNHDSPRVKWLYVGTKSFTEPFFDQTIGKCQQHDYNSRRFSGYSDLSILKEWSLGLDVAQPAAFIFHISRCGSTTLSQLLAIPTPHIVLSEVPFFDDLLRLPYKNDHTTDAGILAAAIHFYSQRRKGGEANVFVKTDSWHIFFYEELRSLYPNVPFFLLYRSPDEVLRSLQKKPGMQSVPGLIEPDILGLTPEKAAGINYYDYPVVMLEQLLAAFIRVAHNDQNAHLVNYTQGMVNIVDKVLQSCNLSVSAADKQLMHDRASFHGKYPGQHFNEPEMPAMADPKLTRVAELYEVLEQLRWQKEVQD